MATVNKESWEAFHECFECFIQANDLVEVSFDRKRGFFLTDPSCISKDTSVRHNSPNGSQGTGGPSPTAEKQISILTRLKQEQAEIRHLQNIGRAAHRERKLLLQQQKELLEVQRTTTQLWLQLAGELPHPIPENYNLQGVGLLEKETFEPSSKAGPLLATPSEGTERRSSREAGKKHLAESKDILPPENRAAEGFEKWKEGKETTIQDLYDLSGRRSRDPTLGDGRTADHLSSRGGKEYDHGLTKNSQDDHPGSPLDKDPEDSSSAGFPSALRGFSPYPEKSPSGLEFHKGYAVLVHLSGSSPSDLEDEGLQDTDVSLPEEFLFQEPLPEQLGVSTHHQAPAVPRIVINTEDSPSSSEKKPQGELSGGDLESRDSACALYSQEKIWEDTRGRERLEESDSVILSNHGRVQESPSPVAKKDRVHTPSTAASLNISEELSCTENGGDEMTSGSPVDPGMVFFSTNVPFQSPGAEGKKDPAPSSNEAGEDVEDENPPRFGNQEAIVTLAPVFSLNIGAPEDPEDPLHGPKHSRGHRFPISSGHLPASGDQPGCANRSTDECVSHKPVETSVQLHKTSMGNGVLVEEHRKSSPARNQSINKAEMPTVRLSSLQEEDLMENEGDAMLLPELDDDVVSPVDEMLTYGSSDLPSSSEKDVSSWSTDLPAPPENHGEANSSLLNFPSPPDPVGSSEAEELSSPRDLPAEGVGSSLQA
ncbi:PREDICTED: uncharacterized protein LOC106549905 [Thamnophis sirtalis]|uniref:Uncharacterized protein LOC106549905 n=1 Tax=Thamnophis sirtalis TaxID=35019 RepID=A0A6I9YFU8_9SAUR|nr:PREDICTED: uncharacterized protein LOC106549905 [Thamnophis sirtalis]